MKHTGSVTPAKKLFSDAAGTVEISNPTAIKATGHNLKKVEKKDATATEEGNSTYWFCDKCNKYFSDAKAETEIKKGRHSACKTFYSKPKGNRGIFSKDS